jgi:hypothetical protein
VKTANRNQIVFAAFFVMLFITQNGNAQNYRNPQAYIEDFERNELFVKESLIEYTTAVITISPDYRTKATLERIFKKLENVNTILLRNDIGLMGDTDLRDAFIRMNAKTVSLLRNKILILNDYSEQSILDYPQILKNLSFKENEISSYYKGLIDYENSKRDFALKYAVVIIGDIKTKNAFESNANQNIIFYKMNVLDEKLTVLLKERDLENVKECFKYIDIIGTECLKKTDQYKNDFKDASLNNANIGLVTFMLKQKETLLPAYSNYVKKYDEFQKIKADKTISDAQYNTEVKLYNNAKNLFFDTLYNVQLSKKEMVDSWYVTNSKFLINNTDFANQQDKLTNLD